MIDRTKYCVAGQDFKINDNITIHNPTLQEIIDFGERNYEKLCGIITMRPYDDMVNLWDRGIDYTQVKDYDLFITNIIHLNKSDSSILFGDLDFTKFKPMTSIPQAIKTEKMEGIKEEKIEDKETKTQDSSTNADTNIEITSSNEVANDINDTESVSNSEPKEIPQEPIRIILYQKTDDGREIVIDEAIYNVLVEYVRAINDIDAKIEYDVGNEAAKMFLIERTRTKIKRASRKPYQHKLCNYISAIIAMGIGYTYSTILDLKISQMYDLFKRINKIEEYRNLISAAHAGAKLSGDDRQRLNWYGNFN